MLLFVLVWLQKLGSEFVFEVFVEFNVQLLLTGFALPSGLFDSKVYCYDFVLIDLLEFQFKYIHKKIKIIFIPFYLVEKGQCF